MSIKEMFPLSSPHAAAVWVTGGWLLTAALYWLGLHGSFFFDDQPNILDNPAVRLANFSREEILAALHSGLASGIAARPVSQFSFALNHYFCGFDPYCFKLTNLVIHCLNGGLIFLLARRIFSATQEATCRGQAGVLAGILALLWLVHPVQLTSVLYVVQRMTSLSALFLLAAMIVYVWVRERPSINIRGGIGLVVCWGVLWPFSILAKESGFLFPGFVAAYELIIRRNQFGRLDVPGRTVLCLVLALPLALAGLMASGYGDWLVSGYAIRGITLTERLMTESRVLWEYLGLIFLPELGKFGLFHDDFALSHGLLDPWTTLPGILGLLAVAVFAVWKSKSYPLIAFGVAWFLIGHALESTFIPLEIFHEHRNYLAVFGPLLMLVGLSAKWLGEKGPKRNTALALLVAYTAYCGFVTALRSSLYSNEARRTQIEVQYHPDSARSHFEAGRTLAGIYDRSGGNQMAHSLAQIHFRRAGKLDANYKRGLLGLLIIDCSATGKSNPADVDELARRFRETPIAPEDPDILKTVSKLMIARDLCLDRSAVDRLFEAGLASTRVSPEVRMSLHSLHADYLWLAERDLAGAMREMSAALEILPHHAGNRLKWAQLILLSGDRVEARRLLEALRHERFSPVEQKTLADLLVSTQSGGD